MPAQDRGEADLDWALMERAAERWPQQEPGEELDAMALAAYLDGMISESEAERVETAMAGDVRALNLWLQADEAVGARYPVPPSLLARLGRQGQRAEGQPGRGHPGRERSGRERSGSPLRRLLAAMALQGERASLGWAVAGALFLAVCVGGFELGQYGYRQDRDGMTQTAQIEASPFDLPVVF